MRSRIVASLGWPRGAMTTASGAGTPDSSGGGAPPPPPPPPVAHDPPGAVGKARRIGILDAIVDHDQPESRGRRRARDRRADVTGAEHEHARREAQALLDEPAAFAERCRRP